jgi:hypothetical protein
LEVPSESAQIDLNHKRTAAGSLQLRCKSDRVSRVACVVDRYIVVVLPPVFVRTRVGRAAHLDWDVSAFRHASLLLADQLLVKPVTL